MQSEFAVLCQCRFASFPSLLDLFLGHPKNWHGHRITRESRARDQTCDCTESERNPFPFNGFSSGRGCKQIVKIDCCVALSRSLRYFICGQQQLWRTVIDTESDPFPL